MILSEFSKSPLWSSIKGRVLATFGFSGMGTATHALSPNELTMAQSANVAQIEYLISIFTLISYGISIIVALSVLWRFIIWLKDRKKEKTK